MLDRLIQHRRALHRIPETGYDLPKTQEYVLSALSKTRAEVTPLFPSGIIAFLDFGAKESVAFRADMDALEMEEQSGAAFSSCHSGKMHACGHDGHMAILLTLIETLSNETKKADKNAVFVFQPAEEAGNGAKMVLESNFIQKYSVSEIYALHVEPTLPIGYVAAKPGAFMARSCEVHVIGHGKSAHIAKASEGVDALEMCARFYLRAIDTIEEKYKGEPHLFKFGRFLSGTANNILSAHTQIDGSLRAFDDRVFFSMKEDLHQLANELSDAYGGRIEVLTDEGYPPVINSDACFNRLKNACMDMPFITLTKPYMTAEDFSCYLQQVPGLMFNIGLGTNTELHSSAFRFDERALIPGVTAFSNIFHSK